MKCTTLPQLDGLLKFMLNLICRIYVQVRELYFGDFIKYTFTIGRYLDACVLISFQLGMMLDINKLFDVDLHSKLHVY